MRLLALFLLTQIIAGGGHRKIFTPSGPVPTLLQVGLSTTDGVFVASVPSHAAGGMTCVKGSFDIGLSSAISNTAGYTWTLEVTNSTADGNYDLQIWCSPKTAFGSTDTVTVTNVAFHGGIMIEDWSIVTSAAATGQQSDGSGSSVTITTGPITFSGADGVISVIGRPNGGGDLTSTGMTSQTSTCGGCSFWGFDAYNMGAYKLTSGSPVTANIGVGTFWDTAAVVLH